MKRFLRQFVISLCLACALVPAIALAVDSRDLLMGLGMSPEVANRIYTTLIGVDSSGSVVIPVASGEKLSVTVAGTEKFAVTSAGDLAAPVSGNTLALQEATAGAKCMGTATATGTTAVTVSTTCATTGSRILLTRSSAPSGTAICWQTNIVTGVSFDLDCSGAETGTFDWLIIHEAA
jgi:hypothetical protein